METLSLFPLSPPLPSSHVIRHVSLTTMQPHNSISSSRSMHSPLSSSNYISPQTVIINMKKKNSTRNNNNNNKRRGVKCLAGVREIKESEFSEVVLKSELPVLVEFVANWCGPCRLISPAVHSLAQEYKEKLTIVKIDHDLNPSLIEEYKVYGLPTLILFKNGKVVPESRREGAITKVKLKAYVDSLLDSISVA